MLLLVGVAFWLVAGVDMPWQRWAIVLGITAASLAPPVERLLARGIARLRRPEPSSLRKLAVALGAMAAFYLIATATFQDRDLFPKMEDECSYVLGARMMAHGHLWMPMHPLADFFESLFVIVKPVYCSIYFPGTALAFCPMAWLGWPSWVLPVIVSGAIVAMVSFLVGELVDGIAAIVAAIWMVSLGEFRGLSVMVMSHLPMLLFGLLMMWAWMRWRNRRQPLRWALLLGVFSGWAAITRPADAVAYALPIGLAILAVLWKLAPRQRIATIGCIILGAAPFLALQIAFDVGVTGKPFLAPYTFSLQHDQPGTEFGFHPHDPQAAPASNMPEKLAYYEWCRQFIEQHRFPEALGRLVLPGKGTSRLNAPQVQILADATMPGRVLWVLVPVGILGLRDRRRLVFAATLLAFLLVYFFNPFFLAHYCLVFAPAVILLALSGIEVLAGASTRPMIRGRMNTALLAAVLALCITSLWEIKHLFPHPPDEPPQDGMLESSPIAALNRELPHQVKPPALVLFEPSQDCFELPVYNLAAPWPDDNPIIRARDLGPRDGDIIRYYAQRQPSRVFYACDPNALTIQRLGTALEMLEKVNRRAAAAPSARP